MSARINAKTKVSGRPAKMLFWVLTVSITIVLPVFYLNAAMDKVLMPRLLLLSVFLFLFTIAFIPKRNFRLMDFSVLRFAIFPVMAGFALLTFLSQFFAIDFAEGLFDTVKNLCVLLLIFYLVQLFRITPDWPEKLTRMVIVAATIAVLIGFYQYLTRVIENPLDKIEDHRSVIYLVKGLMAHKNQFSTSMMLMLPFLGYGIYRLGSTWRALAAINLVMIIFLIVLLQTRSVWTGIFLAVAGILGVFLLATKSLQVKSGIRKVLTAGGLLFVALILIIVFTADEDSENIYFKKLGSITSTESGNNPYRLATWSMTLDIIQEQPITGVGAGNWKINIHKHLHKTDFEVEESNWLRPHNDFLWAFAEKGLIGFLLYTSIFAIAAYYLILVIFNQRISRHRKIFALFILGGLISYTTVSMFTFPYERINQQVYLSIFLAVCIMLMWQLKPMKPVNAGQKIFLIPSLLLMAFSVFYSASALNLEIHMKKAEQAYKKNWGFVLRESKLAQTPLRNIEPEGAPVAWYTGTALTNLGNNREALTYFKKARRIHPYHYIVHNNMGLAYYNLQQYNKAITSFETALTYAPKFPDAKVNLATVYYITGKYKKALDLLRALKWRDRTPTIKNNIKALREKLREIRLSRQAERERKAAGKQNQNTNGEN